ncbi:mitochondrial distribution and morphology proteins-domain-containing protein, partial [Phlebopus sp. FC_14]
MTSSSSLAMKSPGFQFLRYRSVLIQHTSRGVAQPNVDRYAAIRLFFKRQLVALASTQAETRNSRFSHLESKKANASGQHDSHTPEEKSPRPPDLGQKSEQTSPETVSHHLPPLNLDNYPRLYRRLAQSLSHLHRPTRDDFLRVANGFWQRLRIRFKWFTIRSFRKFNADDISAFVTWFLMSQTLWVLVGTTTFFSVIFATANSLRLQQYVARAISNYLTSETGVTVIFESAIVPKWKDSRISFKNVYISRRPQSNVTPPPKNDPMGHRAAIGYDVSAHPAYNYSVEDEEEVIHSHSEDDINYSMFDLNIDSIDVTLSLRRWLDGKGLVEDAVVKGVRGVLDRRSVFWDPEHPLDPAAFRHVARPGDFELNSLQLEDVLITVYQPGEFRPYTASIFRADMRSLRKQWLFYDFLRAENVVGQFDNCLFSLHKPQSIGRTTDQDLKDGKWSRMSRIRIDGVNIDHMQNSTTDPGGPLSWITSGKVDAVLDIKFPRDREDEFVLNAILGELADAITTAASASLNIERIPGQRELAKPPLSAPSTDETEDAADKPRVVIDIDLRFRDLKAAVPLFTQDLSYVNNALVRPIVAFMNAHHTLVPIHCKVVKDLNDFDGAWTMWETGLMDEISQKIYDALAYHVTQANMNRRVKAVGVWSLQRTASAMLSALRNLVDPMASQLREVYYVNGIPYDALL